MCNLSASGCLALYHRCNQFQSVHHSVSSPVSPWPRQTLTSLGFSGFAHSGQSENTVWLYSEYSQRHAKWGLYVSYEIWSLLFSIIVSKPIHLCFIYHHFIHFTAKSYFTVGIERISIYSFIHWWTSGFFSVLAMLSTASGKIYSCVGIHFHVSWVEWKGRSARSYI